VPSRRGTTRRGGTFGKQSPQADPNDESGPLDTKLVKNVIVVTGQIDITFADYGIEKPVSVRVLSTEDRGVMELQLFFTKQESS